MENDKLLLCILIVFSTLSIILASVLKLDYPLDQLTIASKEITVKVPGLESAYHWVKKLSAKGYFVELRPINEPGYIYEVHGIKYGLSS
jgi:hypothetical protein